MNKTTIQLIAAFLMLTLFSADSWAQSAIYACGHIRRERAVAIPNLKMSGYTTAIIFNINVEVDGSLTTDFNWSNQQAAQAGGIICQDGKYVFDTYQPYFVDDIKSLLAEPTSINRIEFCIGGWGNGSYGNIRNLVNSCGTGPRSILYKNFKALKDAIPEVVAVNNDQEQDYDVASATAFHKMLAEIGFKTTVAPYMNRSYWQQLVESLNQGEEICDIVYLQTYGGGAGNNPNDWKVFGDIPMYVGFDCESNGDISAMQSQFEYWKANSTVSGGFLWNYNSESRNVNQWATAINRIFPTLSVAADDVAATFHQNRNYEGYSVALPVGEFDQAELALWGIQAKGVLSMTLAEGYKATIYSGADFTGQMLELTESTDYFGSRWISRGVCSVVIEPVDENGIADITVDNNATGEIFDLYGRKVANPGAPGLYITGGKKFLVK